MPNDTANMLVIRKGDSGPVLKTIIRKDSYGKDFFDLNTIIPRPKDLDIDAVCMGESLEGTVHILSNKTNKTAKEIRDLELAKKQLSNRAKYGHTDWYSWSVANWGTKWNTYCCDVGSNSVYFETAWSPPQQVLEELAVLFPNHVMEVYYADEGGAFVGTYILKDGELEDIRADSNTVEERDILEKLGRLREPEEDE